MKVTQEKLPASQLGLDIEITPEQSKQAYEKAIQGFIRSANIPGFRRGKVPRQVVIQRFGEQRIKASVLEELIESGLKDAIAQENINAIGNYKIRSSFDDLVAQFKPGEALTFSVSVDVPPEVSLKAYTELSLTATAVDYDPEDVIETLEDYRQRAAALVPIDDRPAAYGDLAVVDFVGRVQDEESDEWVEFPGGSATDFQIELQSDRFIEGFIDGVIGMAVGETKEVSATFPENYPQEELAGKAALFTITVKELKERDLPDLDDDFAQEVSEYETLEEFQASLQTLYQEQADKATQQNKEKALLDALVEQVEVELPETLILEELNAMISQLAFSFSQQGMDVKKLLTPEIIERMRQQSRPEAILNLKKELALAKVAELESITVDEEAIAARIEELVTSNPDQTFDPERLKEFVTNDLQREKVLAFLEENNHIELVLEDDETEDTAVNAAEATVEAAAVDVEEAAPEAPEAVEPEVVEPEAVEPEEKPSKGKKKSASS
jgi:trigger factor